MYDAPDANQPNRKKLAKVYSKLNSSVNLFMLNKRAPDQKPTHIGQ